MNELERAVTKLKRNKAIGPDGIPNELFIEANKTTKKSYTQTINDIHIKGKTPQIWNTGIITTIYKGKGKKGKCSNERGITVASNIGKVYERIIDNRIRHQIRISEDQAGGIKGKSTTDHLLIIKEIIQNNKDKKSGSGL